MEVCTRFEGEEQTFRIVEEIPCDSTHDRAEHFLQCQPIQDATPLRDNNSSFNQETRPTIVMGNQTTDALLLTQLNPDVHPYVSPAANDLRQRGQTQPNVTSANVA